jgi:D-alanyl-D-alanine carboxypeptidase/D-alanyl-D-alanine-endopeptidase (penicillin-binding protein 4)
MHKVGILAVLLVLAAGALVEQGVIPTVGSGTRHPRHAVARRVAPELRLPPAAVAGAVLPPVPTRPVLSRNRLRARLHRLLHAPALGPRVGFAVAGLTGAPVRLGNALVVTPASTTKLLTTTAALDLLGPEHEFKTTTRLDPGRRLVLVGGGDPLLSNRTTSPLTGYPRAASLRQLARRTARRLRAGGVTTVHLEYDATLFRGPSGNPFWEPTYLSGNVVTRTSALWVDQGRRKPYVGERERDPAALAAGVFARDLVANGVHVRARIAALRTPTSGRLLATVRSAPLRELVDFILETSNNEGAETLLRHIAIAGHRVGTTLAGLAVERPALRRLGLSLTRSRIDDGSGLSRHDRVTVTMLVRILQIAASASHPQLRGVITGLPIAGYSGTLTPRFRSGASAAVGVARVKTGTLTGVTAFAGTVTARDGVPLVFAIVADRVAKRQTWTARVVLDRVVAALTTCGCER